MTKKNLQETYESRSKDSYSIKALYVQIRNLESRVYVLEQALKDITKENNSEELTEDLLYQASTKFKWKGDNK